MSRILYHERIEHWAASPLREQVEHYVEVEVRSWVEQGMTPDVVIETRVLVDRKLVVDKRKACAHSRSDAAFIRQGINEFDALVAAHPFFSHEEAA